MTSWLVLKSRNGECFVIRHGYKLALPASSKFTLTKPIGSFNIWQDHGLSQALRIVADQQVDGFYILFNLCEAPNRLPENIVCIIVIHR